MLRRTLLALCALSSLAAVAPAQAADNWPSQPIKFVVPYPPGGPVDSIVRLIGPGLSKELGQPVVIENRAGAAGMVGIQSVLAAEPNGYTFGVGVLGAFAVQPHVGKMPFKLEDVNYVTLMTQSPHVIVVNPASGISDLKGLIEAARKAPGKLNYGSPGNGSSTHLDGELLSAEAHIEMQHVPYKGGPQATNALLANEVQMLAVEISAALPLQDRLKIAAIMGDKRSPLLPQVPTTAELGYPSVTASSMYGVIAPPRTPREIVEKFRKAVTAVLQTPEVRNRLAGQGQTVVPGTPEDYRKAMQAEYTKWGNTIRTRKIRFD